MGLSIAAKVAARLIGSGVKPSTPVAVIENASLPQQRAFAGRLDELGRMTADGLTGPALFIIGDVVAESRLGLDAAPLAEIAA
jgi:siroheme synthase